MSIPSSTQPQPLLAGNCTNNDLILPFKIHMAIKTENRLEELCIMIVFFFFLFEVGMGLIKALMKYLVQAVNEIKKRLEDV